MRRTFLLASLAVLAMAALAQSADDLANRAFGLLEAKNYDAAFPLMLQAAEKGDCISMGNLGTMYYKGLGTDIDYNQALRWWGKAEEKGSAGTYIQPFSDLRHTAGHTGLILYSRISLAEPVFNGLLRDHTDLYPGHAALSVRM